MPVPRPSWVSETNLRIRIGVAFILFISANYSWAREETGVTVDVLERTTKSWDGSTLPAYPDGNPEVTILKITRPPHATLPWHKHPIINAGAMIKGELTVVTENNQKLYLKPADTIVEVVDKWHHGINEGMESVETVVFYAGVVDTPLSINRE